MKKYLFLFILLGLLAPSLAAQDFTEGIFTYRVLNDDQGNPTTNVAIVDISADETTDIVLPSSVSQNDVDYSVTCLVINIMPSNGFKSVYIPSSIVEIPYHFLVGEIECDPENPAFTTYDGVLYTKDFSELYLCPKNKEEFTTHEATKIIRDNAFSCSTRIKTIVLNEGLESIGYQAFSHCSSLTQINLPSTLKSIGRYAFANCHNLNQTMEIGADLTEVNPGAFSYSGIVGFSVVRNNPNYSDFDGNLYSKDYAILKTVVSAKQTISYPSVLNTIGERAFEGSTMENIIVPDGVTTLEVQVFQNSKSKSISLPNSIKVIPSDAFYGCENLVSVNIPTSVVEIGSNAFGDCRALKTIVIPETITKVSAAAFQYANYSDNKVIFLGKEVEIDTTDHYETGVYDNLTYYAAGNTYSNLYWAFNSNDEIVKPLPETLLNGWAVDLGANSTYNISLGLSNCGAPASGLQFDITFPQGVTPEQLEISDNTSNCKSEWTKLANGDYRVLAYTANAQPFANRHVNFGMVLKSDETIGRSEALFHNIKFSMEGASYSLPDETMYITGYDINVPDLGEIEEGDVVGLPDPLSVQYEDVTYRWISSAETVAKIVDNSALQTLSPGTFQLQVQVSDPQGYVPIAYRTVTVTPALWGDADRSKAIDLADVVAVVNHILEREVENFSEKLADVNRDGSIDVADLTSIVKLVLAQPVPDEGGENVAGAPGLRELSFGEAQLGADGKCHISLEIETSSAYTAMQTDIELPDGYKVEAVSLGSELGKHALDYAAVAPQTTRLILYSGSLAELPAGRKAAVVDLTLSGAGEGSIRASRALACDADGRSYTLAATEAPLNVTTGVSSAEGAGMSATAVAGGIEITAPEGTAVTVSDIAGRVLLSFTADAVPAFRPFAPGVYVVAFEGSTATAKVLVK